MGEAEEDGKKEEAHNNDEEGGVGAKEKEDKGEGEKKDKKTKKKKSKEEGKDKKDPAKARTKLEKLEARIDALLANQAKAPQDDADGKAVDYENMETEVQALVAKKEELLKLLNEDHQEGEEGKEMKEKKKTKDKKEKNPEDKKDPAKLRAKLGKIETQMQELATKKEQVMKLLHEVENSADPPATSSC